MQRIPERELMDDEGQALAYARADFGASNQRFVEAALRVVGRPRRHAIDLGCGPGDVMVRLAHGAPDVRITAVDGSGPMLRLARQAVTSAGLENRIRLVEARLPALPFGPQSFDTVLSKDLLHHLPDPGLLWGEVARLGRPGAVVCVMDLVRPDTPAAARDIVAGAARDESPVLQQDFLNSLCAAFTPDEVREQVSAAGLALDVSPIGDRHLLVAGTLA
jgi:ubiquinone/menaquinone biosynthesis C-methylase UbiE